MQRSVSLIIADWCQVFQKSACAVTYDPEESLIALPSRIG
jgi:hypothetical protein